MTSTAYTRQSQVILPDSGRAYEMGPMRAVFKADGAATAARYSVAEWWLEPHERGPGVYQHSEDHVYYIIEGALSVCLDGAWVSIDQGGYALIPGGTPHDFQNPGAVRAGFISFNTPCGFEDRMPDIAEALSADDLAL